MLYTNEFPILEFDTATDAKINPSMFADRRFSTDKLVITFFPEVIESMLGSGELELAEVIPGENPLNIYKFTDDPDILITLGQIGCPACAGNLDLFNAMGISKVMFCGGGGVLDRSITVGRFMLIEGAIRDEGFTYHYLAPSRCVYANKQTCDTIAGYLDAHEIPYIRTLAWTTDAIFRETPDRIARRREEGALVVEMEQAGCLAVAQVRGFAYGALVYGGDDVSQEVWSRREWRSRKGMRYDLVKLCTKLVREI